MRNLRQRVAVVAIGLMLVVAAGCGEGESFGQGDASGMGSSPEPDSIAPTSTVESPSPTVSNPLDIPAPTEVTDFPAVPEKEAPMGLDAVKWPDDPDNVKALLDAMPEELNGLELDSWEEPVETERAQISYGPDDEFGLPRLTIIDLTTGSFFPPEWTVDELIAYEIMSGDPLDAGRDGAVVWATGETTENGVPLHTVQWGRAGSTWMFAAGAGDQETLEQLIAAAVDATGSE